TQNLNDEYLVAGNLRNTLVGYTLLSKTSGSQITPPDFTSVLTVILNQLETVEAAVQESCSPDDQTVSAPIEYLKGRNQFQQSIPASILPGFDPGFIHFRAYSEKGFPTAMCPGVKSVGCLPAAMCVGGINTMAHNGPVNECGDFGAFAENRNEADIHDTILIFYDG
uniref:Uncharacterized protein n=1 Tax=Ciona savignyi TaxID=51511 RepID=H2ZPX7_CIOSA